MTRTPANVAPPQHAKVESQELASYIAGVSGEMALLAGRARWPLLSYFLNMARIEAEARLTLADETPRRVADPRRRKAAR